ncbi:N-acetylmuramoyl-L-alanine amidase family protein [Pontivivens insulae]|uniref:N-acetylmuramoyl-L-alanine amidase n=1 Tax=Pontivivens insulae TaxID=1639689 RepID=A0A2R8AB46_9RHOB|nr:N-acetylmuramoyl-L-alanine amidase [Pontivivens insulae]RED11374.1 N-acetylmuramoyl-L-alanine amidase [Pontivivens insulae]SPF29453.1 N-acetylmuramoyl-L-alanine amidase AmiC [Pontivivens insulae]
MRAFHLAVPILTLFLAAFSARAEVLSVSASTSGWFSRETVVTIALVQAQAYRIGVQDTHGQLHVDLVDGSIAADPVIETDGVLGSVRMGRADLNTARITLGFQRQVTLESAGMEQTRNGALLTLIFSVGNARVTPVRPDLPEDPDRPIIVLDPGHGGIDPGAVRDGISEKDIALAFALELRTALEAGDAYTVVMTRETDLFLSLRERVRIARATEAAAFISLHANTVTRGNASGAAVYTLSAEASSAEAAALAALENRADSVGGEVLDAGDDDLALLLNDMTQRETNARSARFAEELVTGLRHSVGVIRSNPHRSAGFRVLKAPDIPSVLVELGFLSDRQDRANMISPAWRAEAIAGIIGALDQWSEQDRILAAGAASQ